jgi:hypothetical protein
VCKEQRRAALNIKDVKILVCSGPLMTSSAFDLCMVLKVICSNNSQLQKKSNKNKGPGCITTRHTTHSDVISELVTRLQSKRSMSLNVQHRHVRERAAMRRRGHGVLLPTLVLWSVATLLELTTAPVVGQPTHVSSTTTPATSMHTDVVAASATRPIATNDTASITTTFTTTTASSTTLTTTVLGVAGWDDASPSWTAPSASMPSTPRLPFLTRKHSSTAWVLLPSDVTTLASSKR